MMKHEDDPDAASLIASLAIAPVLGSNWMRSASREVTSASSMRSAGPGIGYIWSFMTAEVLADISLAICILPQLVKHSSC
jgi:hypothetical protein